MSADFPSSNPFRRKNSIPASVSSEIPSSNTNHIAYHQSDHLPGPTSLRNIEVPKKATKKVRVQSPPPLSPSIPDSSSTIGEESYSITEKPPTPVPRDDDPFDSTSSDSSEDVDIPLSRAPPNPFSKTLETMEPSARGGHPTPTNVTSPGRASLDVEAFKRLLMTGDSGLGVPATPSAAQAHVAHALGDGGSSTDASSVSRQSIFEPIQEAHPESPRTSHEISETDDDHRGLVADISSTPGRKKPPPPSSRHGKLIKMELRGDNPTVAIQSPTTPNSIISQQYFPTSPGSQTDLNKPLPPAPNRASHDSDRESVFDKEAAGKTPEPPSPSSSIRKKTPPAPPLTRRHSQLVSDSKLVRSDSRRVSPKVEEGSPGISGTENNRPRSESIKAPPPPPSRRIGSVRASPNSGPLTSPSSISLPSPPQSQSQPSRSNRPPSVISMDISTNKRASMPPPPPPPRHARSGIEVQSPWESRRPSGEQLRETPENNKKDATVGLVETEDTTKSRHDILADLNKLQREIDELRIQSEAEKVKST